MDEEQLVELGWSEPEASDFEGMHQEEEREDDLL